MSDTWQKTGEPILLRFGAVAAIVGTILQVAAGTSQSALLGAREVALQSLADLSAWVWPTVYLGFVFGALLWVIALVALVPSLADGTAGALGRLAVATVIVGATLHAIDGVLNGFVLTSLAGAWAAAEGEWAALVRDGDLMFLIREATWAGVVTLFHGVPFVLAGLAVARSRRYPAWLGWVGFVGGAGSVIVGVAIFYGGASAGLAVPFAVVLSLFMVVLGGLMWIQAGSDGKEPELS